MADEDLQAFRRHPRIWEDEPSEEKKTPPTQHTISWPLTSFANTIQNVCCISFIFGFLVCLNLSLLLAEGGARWARLHVYFLLLLGFHLLEFLTTAIFNPSRVTVDSFLLNNGLSYWWAQAVCVVEYVLEERYFRGALRVPRLEAVGLAILLLGQLVRTLAMITAAHSFNHRVSDHQHKRPDHVLVTHGVYAYFRHPSYFGFFWWSIGIQIFLTNPLSLLCFSAVLWSFFNSRIQHEEFHLEKFFKQAYRDYRARTPTRIPFIK